MAPPIPSPPRADPGLEALVILLQVQGIAADGEQIPHRLGVEKTGTPEILWCAKATDDKVLIQLPQTLRPALMTRAEIPGATVYSQNID